MGKTRYSAGDIVPDNICEQPSEWVLVRFAIPVEVYYGYGSVRHVYPTEPIERTEELFNVDGERVDDLVNEYVQLYTTPHHELR
ncbi:MULTISPECIES: hypothetical protein [Haloferax]|uniref:Uncharacterized protein n=2 Tax=Haloferax TaxID=2251 RepID=A0A6G1Z0Y3_9EURY|nr:MULTISPECIES: hypothetical protein [Haloferax]KAB1187533.1 hypothetical protein Hfx1149_05595 [Haloferax sp. CBA1149]MRW80186.1 hypothetical protein [Haloferax marinisediminis]